MLKSLSEEEKSRLLYAYWENYEEEVFQVKLHIIALDRPKITADIMTLVNDTKVHISAINSVSKNFHTNIDMSLEIANLSQLNILIDKIRSIKDVEDVKRSIAE